MISYLRSTFHSLKSELVLGVFSHTMISPMMILLLSQIIIGWFTCINTIAMFISIELAIISSVVCRLDNRKFIIPLLIRFCFSRIVICWLFYTIYSQWYFDDFTLFTQLSFLTFPFLLSWYIFDPFLLPYRRYSLSDRFDYFLSRFSFFTGVGIVPFLVILFWLLLDLPNYFVYLTICIMCNHKTLGNCPNYARYLPYTKTQFIIDPLDNIESIIDRYN